MNARSSNTCVPIALKEQKRPKCILEANIESNSTKATGSIEINCSRVAKSSFLPPCLTTEQPCRVVQVCRIASFVLTIADHRHEKNYDPPAFFPLACGTSMAPCYLPVTVMATVEEGLCSSSQNYMIGLTMPLQRGLKGIEEEKNKYHFETSYFQFVIFILGAPLYRNKAMQVQGTGLSWIAQSHSLWAKCHHLHSLYLICFGVKRQHYRHITYQSF